MDRQVLSGHSCLGGRRGANPWASTRRWSPMVPEVTGPTRHVGVWTWNVCWLIPSGVVLDQHIPWNLRISEYPSFNLDVFGSFRSFPKSWGYPNSSKWPWLSIETSGNGSVNGMVGFYPWGLPHSNRLVMTIVCTVCNICMYIYICITILHIFTYIYIYISMYVYICASHAC